MKTLNSWLLAVWMVCCSLTAQAGNSTLNIADAQGDWGLLAPFSHVARGPGYVYTSFIFDSLVWRDVTGQLQPMLAKSWNYHAEDLCYDFILHEQARWHDGQPVTAEDVLFSFSYMQQHAYRFVDFSPISSVQATGRKVSVCLKEPHAPFMSNIAATLPILPRHVYQHVEEPQRFNQLGAATGSGPYRLAAYNRAKGYYRLERNASYHLGLPKYERVQVVRMSPHAALDAMQRGQVDFVSLPQELAGSYREAGLALAEQLSNHPYRLLFNHQGSFARLELRQGLAQLLDRQHLIDILYPEGAAQIARLAYRQDVADALPNDYGFDPAAAAAQLEQAGWQKNSQGRWQDAQGNAVHLTLLASPGSALLARALAEQLERQGVALEIRLEQDVQLGERLRRGSYDLALLSASHEGDADRFRWLMGGQQQRSDHYLQNDELLELLDRQVRILDVQQRSQLLHQAELIYNRELPSLLLVNPISYAAYRPQVLTPRFTNGGIAMGVPLPLNKLDLFLRD